jgi:hypothetical protein
VLAAQPVVQLPNRRDDRARFRSEVLLASRAIAFATWSAIPFNALVLIMTE